MDKIYQVTVDGIWGVLAALERLLTRDYFSAAEPRSNNTSSHPKTSGRVGKIYQVMVDGIRGETVVIDLCNTEEQMKSMTVLQLKEKIAQKLPDIPGFGNVRLIFVDQSHVEVLDNDSRFLYEYGISHMSVLHLVLKIPGGGGPLPPKGDGGMGDKDDKHRMSMERLHRM